MAAHPLSKLEISRTLAALRKHGSDQQEVARACGISIGAIGNRVRSIGRAATIARAEGNEKKRAAEIKERGARYAKAPEVTLEDHRQRDEISALKARNKQLLHDLDRSEKMRALGDEAKASIRPVSPIKPREGSSGLREATALALASDWHVEEEVRPEQVSGRNRYNLEISEARMRRFFAATRWAIEFNRQAFKIRDLILWLGGDLITNYLHEDNVESNLLPPVGAIAYVMAHISAGIKHLLDDGELERIVIPCNDGNHGRLTEKTRSASRTANSIEWLLYQMLAREWAHEKRVEFTIAQGEHLYLGVYDKTVRFVHGDTVRYAGGVGGITIPLMKSIARWDTVRRADLTALGHFHSLISLSDVIVNGSLIGFSPYSVTIGARFEPPAQAFTILDSKRWKSVNLPLWVAEGEDDSFSSGQVKK